VILSLIYEAADSRLRLLQEKGMGPTKLSGVELTDFMDDAKDEVFPLLKGKHLRLNATKDIVVITNVFPSSDTLELSYSVDPKLMPAVRYDKDGDMMVLDVNTGTYVYPDELDKSHRCPKCHGTGSFIFDEPEGYKKDADGKFEKDANGDRIPTSFKEITRRCITCQGQGVVYDRDIIQAVGRATSPYLKFLTDISWEDLLNLLDGNEAEFLYPPNFSRISAHQTWPMVPDTRTGKQFPARTPPSEMAAEIAKENPARQPGNIIRRGGKTPISVEGPKRARYVKGDFEHSEYYTGICPKCKGKGFLKSAGKKKIECDKCFGTGETELQQAGASGGTDMTRGLRQGKPRYIKPFRSPFAHKEKKVKKKVVLSAAFKKFRAQLRKLHAGPQAAAIARHKKWRKQSMELERAARDKASEERKRLLMKLSKEPRVLPKPKETPPKKPKR
jgi:hypothetical protein